MQVRFEPGRLAASCLIDAYERVLPSRHGKPDAAAPHRLEDEPRSQRHRGGRSA
jgi:hypothetical protein